MNRSPAPRWLVLGAFAASGGAGLAYEVLWTRYLGLFVGHGAYAQVLVLAVYLGGMALGAWTVGRIVDGLDRPLLWYAAAEVVLAGFGLAFHPVFTLVTEASYQQIFPALGSAALVGSARWSLAGMLILPQAVVLGGTFPLMAAGLVRTERDRPGRGVAEAYLLNTLGGALGVLVTGFWLVPRLGLPGASSAAAVLNLLAAGSVWYAVGVGGGSAPDPVAGADAETRSPDPPAPPSDGVPPAGRSRSLRPETIGPVLLVVSFGTALASFAYEIAWIRMLSLVLGSATHSFELMLSAFILGLAVGAWLVRDVTDRTADPLRALGGVQALMGVAAMVSLPMYLLTFDWMAGLVTALQPLDEGYAIYNVIRYGICLLVMLPATVLAGMTLPLVTGTLLRAGAGERAIGQVYAANTVGSVAGVGVAGLVALPALGLEGLLTAGAVLDILLGIWLLERSWRLAGGTPRAPLLAAAATGLVVFGIATAIRLDPTVLTSGVFGRAAEGAEGHLALYYEDGRTATVSAHVGRADGVIVLATNGKPDASFGPRWVAEGRDTLPVRPIEAGTDYTTQVLSPLIALAHHPTARTAANIGHGSGMSAAAFLAGEHVERLVTIEIEPLMVEASVVFMPANATAFADPRSTFVFDDAKSFFTYSRERFDAIFAEPSNPWVSGIASLFTMEFYRRVRGYLADGGVFAQWVQLYELDDELFVSILAALDTAFPSYRGYLVGDSDLVIVASADRDLAEPDWSVFEAEGARALMVGVPPFTPAALGSLLLFDETTFRAVLDGDVTPNSDYDPVLDAGAERARFDQSYARGLHGMAVDAIDLRRMLSDDADVPAAYSLPPALGLSPAVLGARASWLREALSAGGGIAPEAFPEWTDALVNLRLVLEIASREAPPTSWPAWSAAAARAHADLHWGSFGWVDTSFYRVVDRFLERASPPPAARAVVDLMRGSWLGDWRVAADASDALVPRVRAGELWMETSLLMDLAVVARLRVGDTPSARRALESLRPRSGRDAGDLRDELLSALVAPTPASAR